MRSNSTNFDAKNNAPNKELRLVVKIEFDATNNIYFISHSDIAISGETVVSNVLRKTSSTSQRLDPNNARATIGAINFELVDVAEAVTTVFRDQLSANDNGLRGKTIELYLGYKSLAWADYRLEQTQVIDKSVTYMDGVYKVQCRDIQREARKQIFEVGKTRLSAAVALTDDIVEVYDTSDFNLIAHGSSYTADSGVLIFYFKIKAKNGFEICSATGKTATSFTGVTRGLFGTTEIVHEIGTDENSSPEVTEYIYIEMPAIKLVYAILTGVLIGQAETFPESYHLGIDPAWVDLDSFTGIGTDLYDHTNDELGSVVRFQGLTKVDGKRFVEQQLLLLTGCMMPVLPSGKLSLKTYGSVLTGASYVAELDESNVRKYSALNYDLSAIKNKLDIHWAWLELQNGEKDFYRINKVIDLDSITKFGETDAKPLKFYGLHSERHTQGVISGMFDAFRDRVAGPAARLSLDVLPSMNNIEVGDIVRVNLAALRDHTGINSLDRSMEVQGITIDQVSQSVKLALFGSTQPAGLITSGGNTVLPDSWYCDESAQTMIELSTVLTIVGGIVTANGTLSGDETSHLNAVYYYTGDLTIQTGVTVTIGENVQIRIRGHLTVNGKIDGKGFGLAASLAGQAGFIGSTKATGDVEFENDVLLMVTSGERFTVNGQYSEFPAITLLNNAGTISGWPLDLRGTSGSQGGNADTFPVTTSEPGGAGGNGGAGLVIICRGMSFGLNGEIDLSGDDGTTGTIHPTWGAFSGSGGGGSAGGLLLLLDGSGSNVPFLNGKLTLNRGAVIDQGFRFPMWIQKPISGGHSYFEGFTSGEVSASRMAFIPDSNETYPAYSCGGGGGTGGGTNTIECGVYPSNIINDMLTDPPVAFFRLDETSGIIANDLSTTANNGTFAITKIANQYSIRGHGGTAQGTCGMGELNQEVSIPYHATYDTNGNTSAGLFTHLRHAYTCIATRGDPANNKGYQIFFDDGFLHLKFWDGTAERTLSVSYYSSRDYVIGYVSWEITTGSGTTTVEFFVNGLSIGSDSVAFDIINDTGHGWYLIPATSRTDSIIKLKGLEFFTAYAGHLSQSRWFAIYAQNIYGSGGVSSDYSAGIIYSDKYNVKKDASSATKEEVTLSNNICRHTFNIASHRYFEIEFLAGCDPEQIEIALVPAYNNATPKLTDLDTESLVFHNGKIYKNGVLDTATSGLVENSLWTLAAGDTLGVAIAGSSSGIKRFNFMKNNVYDWDGIIDSDAYAQHPHDSQKHYHVNITDAVTGYSKIIIQWSAALAENPIRIKTRYSDLKYSPPWHYLPLDQEPWPTPKAGFISRGAVSDVVLSGTRHETVTTAAADWRLATSVCLAEHGAHDTYFEYLIDDIGSGCEVGLAWTNASDFPNNLDGISMAYRKGSGIGAGVMGYVYCSNGEVWSPATSGTLETTAVTFTTGDIIGVRVEHKSPPTNPQWTIYKNGVQIHTFTHSSTTPESYASSRTLKIAVALKGGAKVTLITLPWKFTYHPDYVAAGIPSDNYGIDHSGFLVGWQGRSQPFSSMYAYSSGVPFQESNLHNYAGGFGYGGGDAGYSRVPLVKSGLKVYAEVKFVARAGNGYIPGASSVTPIFEVRNWESVKAATFFSYQLRPFDITPDCYDGESELNIPSGWGAPVDGDVFQIAYEIDTGHLWYGKNNSWAPNAAQQFGSPDTGTPTFIIPSLDRDSAPPMFNIPNTASAACDASNWGDLQNQFIESMFSYDPPAGFVGLGDNENGNYCTLSNLVIPSISLSVSSINETSANGAHTTASVTATPIDITPDSVLWTLESGSVDIGIDSPATAATTFTGTGTDATKTAVFKVTVTDASLNSVSATIQVTIKFGHKVTISPVSIEENVINGANTTISVTASHDNMIEVVTWLWSRIGGSTELTVDSPTAATTTFSSNVSDQWLDADFQVTATDANGDTKSEIINVIVRHGFEVNIVPSVLNEDFGNSNQTTQPVTAGAKYMADPISYVWTRLSGSTSINANSPNSATTDFSSAAVNDVISAVFQVTATDANLDTGSETITIACVHGKPSYS